MPPTIPDDREFVRFRKGGLAIREVPGNKVKPWPHKPDRRIEIMTDGWIAPTLYHQGLMPYLYALNEDGLYPPGTPGKNFVGAKMVWDMLADVPRIGPEAAYEKWVEKPRERKNQDPHREAGVLWERTHHC